MEGNNTSYWLYQLYETRGSQDPIPAYPNTYSVDGEGTMPLVVRKESDDECGYVTYRWVNLPITNAYICDDCGFVPTIYKWEAEYDSSVYPKYKVGCSEGSVITSGETHPAYQEHFYPAKIEYLEIGECVTEIDDDAFKGIGSASRYGVKVIFGDNITRIGNSAFEGGENWEASDISLPASLRTIGDKAFAYCFGLTGGLTIPSGVTSIGNNAFNGCRNLNSLTLSASLRTIGNNAFYNCEGLTGELTIPTGVTSIGESAFHYCSGFTGDLVIPNSVTSIGKWAFNTCKSLTSVTIGSSVTSIGIDAFSYCSGLTSITVNAIMPPTLGYGAFDMTNNCSIYVPCGSLQAYRTATNWSTYADRIHPIMPCNLLKLQELYSDYTTYELGCNDNTELKSSEVKDRGRLVSAVIGDCVTSIGNSAFSDCGGLSSVTIPDSVTSIGERAFQDCTSLTSIDIPSGVTSIENSAFSSCRSLASINIPSGVTSIGNSAFSSCRSLASITIPDSVTSIGESAFNSCSSLTSITIPSGVTSIGNSAFAYCSSLTSITVNATTPPTMSGAFDTTNEYLIYVPCESLLAYKTASGWSAVATRIHGIPPCEEIYKIKNTYSDSSTYSLECNGYKTLSSGETQPSGYQASAMTSSIIGDCVTSIGSSAFTNCSSLTSITIPSGVTSIGNSAFYYCTSLPSINIPTGVTSIGSYAFEYCRSLTGITIPTGVTSISRYTFYDCESLTGVNISDRVTSIGERAFSNCTGLTSVTVNATTPPTLGNNAFYATNNCPIYVPAASVNAYKTATNWKSYASRIQAIP